jgi:PKD repeat protein
MKLFFLIIGLFLFLCVSSQNQGNIWYFGTHAGLDFNTGTPVYVENGMLDAFEGTAVMCNSDGELLFYTDGVTVYTANHNVMYNGFGLLGNSHTTQSALIIPLPGSGSQYLIFTLDYAYSNGTFSYSIVDMTQNSGLGAVTLKNVFIQQGCTEKISAVFHENQQDIWVIIHERDNNVFKSFLINSTGFVNNPVVSFTGPAIWGPQGSLKASPDGNMLAMATYHQKSAEIFHFDALSGIVSYIQGFNYPDATYGVEFSADNSKLYVDVSYDIKEIYQIDLSNMTNALIATPEMAPGAMQLGPDGKIYIAQYERPTTGSSYLGVIHSPELSGTACNFIEQAVFLGSGLSKMGLPNFLHFVSGPITANFVADAGCSNLPVQFTDQSNTSAGYIQRWIWNFGDGSAHDTVLFPDNPNVQHIFANPGSYNVSLTAINNLGQSNSTTHTITIHPGPIADFSYSGSCVNSIVVFSDASSLNGSSEIISWQWDFGDPASGSNNTSVLPDPVHEYQEADTFNVMLVVTNVTGCMDTIIKQVITNQLTIDYIYSTACMRVMIAFNPDTLVVNTESIISWLWDFGDGATSNESDPWHMYNQAGIYSVTLSALDTLGCYNSITHLVSVDATPEGQFEFNSTSCTNSPVQFNNLTNIGNSQTISWAWDFGDGQTSTAMNPSHTYSSPGTYQVCLSVFSECGDDLDCIPIEQFQFPASNFTYNFQGDLEVGFLNLSFYSDNMIWDFGDGHSSTELNPVHTYAEIGDYLVCLTVYNGCGTISYCDSVHVNYYSGDQTEDAEAGLKVFPNPAKDYFLTEAGNAKIHQVEIFNSQGILTDCLVFENFQNNTGISLKGKTPGFYLLRFNTDKGIVTRHLIIQ